MRHLVYLALLLLPTAARAQEAAQMSVRVEITPSVLTLTISSRQLDFGAVSQDADAVIIDPETGARTGLASGAHSTGGLTLTGRPGSRFSVEVTPPSGLAPETGGIVEPQYTLLWARSTECAQSGFTQVVGQRSVADEIGPNGCAQLRFGGMLAPRGASPGVYRGTMSVKIAQL